MLIKYYSEAKAIQAAIYNAIIMVRHPEKVPSEVSEQEARKVINRVALNEGHVSVLEHGLVSFSIQGISRLALEFLEHHRLASYTETTFRRSQNLLDIFQPSSVSKEEKTELLKNISEVYHSLLFRKMAPEDARLIFPSAILSSVFVSVNVREALKMASRFVSSQFSEIITLGVSITVYLKTVFGEEEIEKLLSVWRKQEFWVPWAVLEFPEKAPDFFMSKVTPEDMIELLGVKEKPERASELIQYFVRGFLSTSAVAQLRRHRMVSLFVSYPDSNKTDILPIFSSDNTDIAKKLIELVAQCQQVLGGDYSAPLGRVRKIVFSANKRELEYFVSLRTSEQAQAEIKRFANRVGACL
jgi:thymidylate synthase ThyX